MKELGKRYTKPANSFGGLAERGMRQQMKGCGRASESLFFFLMGYILHKFLYRWKWHGKEEETVEKPKGDDESTT